MTALLNDSWDIEVTEDAAQTTPAPEPTSVSVLAEPEDLVVYEATAPTTPIDDLGAMTWLMSQLLS